LPYSRALKRALGPLGSVALPVEAQEVEHVLRVARVAVAGGSLLAIRLVVGGSGVGARAALFSGAAYLAYSLVLLLWVRNRTSPPWPLVLHGVDFVWAASLPVLTGNYHVPFSVVFLFTLLSAAYRWGLSMTLATVGSMIGLFLLEAGLPALAWSGGGSGSMPDNLPARAIGWVLMGGLVGFLGEGQRVLRERALVVGRLLAGADVKTGTRQTLEEVLREMLELFRAQGLAAVLEDRSSARAYIWQTTGERRETEVCFEFSELNSMERARYLFPAPGDAWCVVQSRWVEGPPAKLIVLDREGRRQRDPRPAGSGFPVLEVCGSYYAASVQLGDEWSGRVLLFDPMAAGDQEAELRLVQALVRQVAPIARRMGLRQGLRREVESAASARLARELHDGVLQTLAVAEMRMEILRRKGLVAPPAAEELERIQELLHHEAVGMRELVHGLRSQSLAPSRLVDSLRAIVDGFREETGIFASFVSQCEEIKLAPVVCREVAQILREALVNVRKHSGAHNVAVRLKQQNGHCTLLIDDDGHGFDFAGRRSLAELETLGQGPWVIKERVRVIQGDLTVESKPGRGSRLEVTVPKGAYD